MQYRKLNALHTCEVWYNIGESSFCCFPPSVLIGQLLGQKGPHTLIQEDSLWHWQDNIQDNIRSEEGSTHLDPGTYGTTHYHLFYRLKPPCGQ